MDTIDRYLVTRCLLLADAWSAWTRSHGMRRGGWYVNAAALLELLAEALG